MPDIMLHFNIAKPAQVCIVGDRISTDVVMGNEHGCYTILVEPLEPLKDNIMVRAARKIE